SEPEQESTPEPEPESQAPTEEPETHDSETDDGGSDDLAEEQRTHQVAAEESASKGGSGDVKEPEEAVGVGTTSPETGSSSHKDVSGAGPAEGGRDVSAYVTPLVRKLAAQHGVDLASLTGTGVGGRIRKQDVLDAAKAKEAPAAEAAPAQQEA